MRSSGLRADSSPAERSTDARGAYTAPHVDVTFLAVVAAPRVFYNVRVGCQTDDEYTYDVYAVSGQQVGVRDARCV